MPTIFDKWLTLAANIDFFFFFFVYANLRITKSKPKNNKKPLPCQRIAFYVSQICQSKLIHLGKQVPWSRA